MQDKIAVQLKLAERVLCRAWELGDELEKAALCIAHDVVIGLQIRHAQRAKSEALEQQ